MAGRVRSVLSILLIGVVTIVLLPVQLLAIRIGRPDPALIPVWWHRLALRLLGIRVRVVGQIAPERPLLLASNHISWADIPVLSSLGPLCFVAKADMAVWPVFGMLARLQRSVFVERDRRRAASRQASELGSRLAAGDVMVLFAEGTTGDGNTMLPFKTTLFGAAGSALDTGTVETVFVQPVTIAYTRLHGMPMGRVHRPTAAWVGDEELVPHLLARLKEGAMDVEVHMHPPVPFTDGSDRKAVARAAEEQVRATMGRVLRAPAR